jgi:hypothetical protein
VAVGPEIAAHQVGLTAVVLGDENVSAHPADYKPPPATVANVRFFP